MLPPLKPIPVKDLFQSSFWKKETSMYWMFPTCVGMNRMTMPTCRADLTEKRLFDLHKAVQTERITDVYKPVGAWKVEPNSTVIVSGDEQIIFEYASPEDVAELMQNWLALFKKLINENQTNREDVLSAYV